MNLRKFLPAFFAVTAMLFLFFSCKKTDYNGIIHPNEVVDLDSKVSASVSGFVTDENNHAISGATVHFGNRTKATDRYGFFEFKDVDVAKNAAKVTVDRRDYFPGIRTFIAREGKPAFVRIKLLPKSNAGTIDAATGGTATLPNGLSVKLPANAVINDATGETYTGNYTVAMQWIDPAAADLYETMPGDLSAVDRNNRMKLLITYGMAAIELRSTSGTRLQLATGKKAAVTFPLPASMVATAPATIPLWYFDEATGLWKEEGSALKTGNFYKGEVSHFSFWNLDIPASFVEFDVTIKDPAGQPIPYALVKLSKLNDQQVRAGGITNSAGYVNGRIFLNEQFKMEVFVGSSCGQPVYTSGFSTATSNISLGTITVDANPEIAQVSGTVTDCSNNPLGNAYVYVTVLNNPYRYTTDQSGNYSFSTRVCNAGATDMTIIADDPAAQQQSPVTTQVIMPGSNTVPNLRACGVNMEEYIFYSIDNDQYFITVPPDSISLNSLSSAETWLGGYQGGVQKIFLQMIHIHVGINGFWPYIASLPGNWYFQSGTINITELGPVGGYIQGTGSGVYVEQQSPSTSHNLTVSFRKRRLL